MIESCLVCWIILNSIPRIEKEAGWRDGLQYPGWRDGLQYPWRPEEGAGFLELELLMVVNHHIGTGN